MKKQTKIANVMISTIFFQNEYETIIFKRNGEHYISTNIEVISTTEKEALEVHAKFVEEVKLKAMASFMGAEVKVLD